MKIALLTASPNKTSVDHKGYRLYTGEKRPPVGLGYLYSVLKTRGYEAEIHDYYAGYKWPEHNYKGYDLVGIYCASICGHSFMDMIEKCEAHRIAVGGPHAHLYPHDFPKKVTYVVVGEGEGIIIPIAENHILPFEDGNIIRTERLSSDVLDQLPRYPWELFVGNNKYSWDVPFDNTRTYMVMNTSRGCPYNCSFCNVKNIWDRRYTYMSAERVVDDIKYCMSLGAGGVYFREDMFTVNKNRIVALCNMILSNSLDLKWMCETRVDSLDTETLQLMHDAGCIGFYLGIEHLSDRMLDVYNKGFHYEHIVDFINKCKQIGIKIAGSFIINHPEETPSDKLMLDKRLPKLKLDKTWINSYRKY